MSVNRGGYLPRRSGSVNIHCYSPPLRWIIVKCRGATSNVCTSYFILFFFDGTRVLVFPLPYRKSEVVGWSGLFTVPWPWHTFSIKSKHSPLSTQSMSFQSMPSLKGKASHAGTQFSSPVPEDLHTSTTKTGWGDNAETRFSVVLSPRLWVSGYCTNSVAVLMAWVPDLSHREPPWEFPWRRKIREVWNPGYRFDSSSSCSFNVKTWPRNSIISLGTYW